MKRLFIEPRALAIVACEARDGGHGGAGSARPPARPRLGSVIDPAVSTEDARGALPPVVVASIDVEPLSVPLREPFVIATGRVDVTRAALVTASVEDGAGRRASGLGEAAALPPVTREDQPDLLAAVA